MIKTPLARRSKSPVARLKAKLDSLVSQYVRKRDDYTCVICGTRNPVWTRGDWTSAECGHIITRTNSALRFDIREDGNCHCQCHRCNVNHGGVNLRFKHFTDQGPYILWYVHKFGLERYEQLRQEANVAKQWKAWELEEMIEQIAEKYKDMLGELTTGDIANG